MSAADPRATALFLGAFFDELTRWGVHDVVVSPGSRSTPLSMTAFELSQRHPERLRVFVDVDERGAAFFALGMAKASGRPAAIICTSGTAVANYYPAVMEAESSRVPLIVLTGDRPPRLQGLGAPQTCDQLKAFGDHVRRFQQMPLPEGDAASMAFARQMAREACIAAGGEVGGCSTALPYAKIDAPLNAAEHAGDRVTGARIAGACEGGPVHLNFPFDEPLKPDFSVESLFGGNNASAMQLPMRPRPRLAADDAKRMSSLLGSSRVLVLAGEGTCASIEEAHEVLAFARAFDAPLLADPLSGLRCFEDSLVIDSYDTVLDAPKPELDPEVIVRFGRYPVSKKATAFAASAHARNIVVDALETRDFNVQTDCFVACSPVEFARDLLACAPEDASQGSFARAWVQENSRASDSIRCVDEVQSGFEGAFVRCAVALAPAESCLFAANSMSIRALDTFYLKSNKQLSVLCNRGLNGIDGTVSSALGAAQHFAQTTLLTGDLTMLHDLNALALQRELRVQREQGGAAPCIVIVLLNNDGGGIFDMLPQQSADPYFKRLFLTPQEVDFGAAANAFGVPHQAVDTVAEFEAAYRDALGVPGISLVEVRVPLEGLKERYRTYWSMGESHAEA